MRARRAGAIATILAVTGVVGVPATAQSRPKTAPPVFVRCPRAAGEDARCGRIERLIDVRRPALGTITIGFELHPRRLAGRSDGTVVAQEGGPGYSTTGSRDDFLALFEPLRARHDVLFVDARGTGRSSPIDCRRLQSGNGDYERAVGRCGRQLGAASDAFGSAHSADDLAAVLDALDIERIDLYGVSYGSFFAQAFANRHPDRLRTLVLDSTYPAYGLDPWYRDTNAAITHALLAVCRRDRSCHAAGIDAPEVLARAAIRLRNHPIRGPAFDADGGRTRVTVDDVALALLAAYATYGGPLHGELVTSIRAANRGDTMPLRRLVAENLGPYPADDPADYSSGEYAAVICNDYPQLWDRTESSIVTREHQYAAAEAQLRRGDPNGFDPFAIDTWLETGWGEWRTCLRWPAPERYVPAVRSSARAPRVPTLILSGDLDSVTSPWGNRIVARRFPRSTIVTISNGVHGMAIGDRGHCVSRVVVRFVRTGGSPGDTRCARQYPEVRVANFAPRLAGFRAPEGFGSPDARRAAGLASATLGDVLGRWWTMSGETGVGLRGGTFETQGLERPVIDLDRVRFVEDVAVSGTLRWNRTTGVARATVTLRGSIRATLTLTWNSWDNARAAIAKGTVDGKPIVAAVPGP